MVSEQEQVEQLQKWWKENGRTLVVGVVVGLSAVFGWNGWQRYQENRRVEASARYEQLMFEMSKGNSEQALARAKSLMDEFPGSGYAALAALLAARAAVDEKHLDEAETHLRWAVDHGADLGLRDLARVRLARVKIAAGDAAGAASTAGAVTTPAYTALAREVEGDALLAGGDPEKAHDAYTSALADSNLPDTARARVELKRDALGLAPRWQPSAENG